MDDINILTLGSSPTIITRKLRQIHSRYLGWAKRYGALFSLEKYSLLYIKGRRNKRKGKGKEREREKRKEKGRKRKEKEFNLEEPIILDNIPIKPSSSIQILGVYITPSLSQKENTLKTKERVLEIFRVLAKSTYSTKGFPPLVARVIYITTLRAIISYRVGIQARDILKGDISSLEVL